MTPPEPAVPRKQQIPGYKLLSRLGSGGQASVYKAVQVSMNRFVAVKVIPPTRDARETDLGRFLREARVLARLRHEGIVQAIDHGETPEGVRYLVMEYVEGEPVDSLIRREGALGSRRSLGIALQVARALEHAASLGVIHRDIKPANILIGKDDRAVLVDFGIARPKKTNLAFTVAGTSIGTPHYMPPEQITADVELDPRADLYALGATLYHMLTGQVPYPKATREGIFGSHLWDPVALPGDLETEIPEAVFGIVARAMEKDRDRRYGSAGEMVAAIESVLAEVGRAPDDSVTEKLRSEVTRLTRENLRLAERVRVLREEAGRLRAERDLLQARLGE